MTRRIAITAIVAICLGGPIVEMFDQWDRTFQDGNDTEANVVVVALCVGVALSISTIVVVKLIRALSSSADHGLVASHFIPFETLLFAAPIPTGSPPRRLRV